MILIPFELKMDAMSFEDLFVTVNKFSLVRLLYMEVMSFVVELRVLFL